jgi:C_GCAxxG_C_C family probable redox protein
MDKNTAERIAIGFGGGMGRTGGVCGAVSGAYMVLGLREYPGISSPSKRKEKVYSLIQKFNKRFKEKYKYVYCTPLLGYNLGTPEGLASRENKANASICPELVAGAVKILEEME